MEALIIPIIISCASGGGVALLAAYGMMKYREGKQETSQESDERRITALEDWKDTEALRDQSMENRMSALETKSVRYDDHMNKENDVLQRLSRIETLLERIPVIEEKLDRIEKNGHK